jgi:Flp pilus assembly protein TadD
MALNDAPAAVEPLGKAARAIPNDAEAALAYARALRAIDDHKAASREFERTLVLRPTDAAAAREHGDLLIERRDYRGAEKRYRQAFDHGLRDVRLLAGLAGALQANGKNEEAVPMLEQAYSLQPTDRLAFELARLYERVGRAREASRLLQKVESRSGQSSRQ